MRRLVLWDVDGTLLRAGRVAPDALVRAVEAVLGIDARGHGVRMSGKTDPQIALEVLAALDVAEADARRHLPDLLDVYERELLATEDRLRAEGEVFPGVVELLGVLDRDPDVLQSTLTGNLAANAAVKLRAFDLDRFLDLEIGAYGSDDADRRVLVPVAIEKAARMRGRRFAPHEVWVVGDTPRDHECAAAGGARSLLVATGKYPLEALEGLGADAVLPNLADVQHVLALLRS